MGLMGLMVVKILRNWRSGLMNVRLMATSTPTRMNVNMMARSRLRSTLMMVKIAPVMLNLLLTKQV